MVIAPIPAYELPLQSAWPPSRASWQFAPERAALLIHDMQEYFLLPYDRTASPLREVARHVRELSVACRQAGVPVIFSAQPGEQDREERGLLWDLWGPGIIQSPQHQVLCEGLQVDEQDIVLLKRRYSAFHATELEQILREQRRDQLLICGVYAHIGCLATALEGFMRGVKPFLVADATADFSLDDHLIALRQVARTCGMVETTASLLEDLRLSSVRRELGRALEADVDAIGLEDDLSDHGLDSIRFMELLERLLPANHGHPYESLLEARSLRALVSFMAPRQAP